MRFTTITITAITRRIWINPPNVYEEINPTNHKTIRIIATVHNMLITLPLFTQFSVVFPTAGSFSFQAPLKQTNSRRLIHQVNYCFNRLHYTSTSFHLQMLAYYMVKSASVVYYPSRGTFKSAILSNAASIILSPMMNPKEFACRTK